MITLPQLPQEIYASKYNDLEKQVISEGNKLFFIDHTEFPAEGGILVYKFGARIKSFPLEELKQKYEQTGFQVQKELEELLKKYDFGLISSDGKETMLVPNEVVRVENELTTNVENRVDLLYPEKGFPDPLAVSLVNQVKRAIKMLVDFFSYKPTMIAFSFFLFLPFKYKIKILDRLLYGFKGFASITLQSRMMVPKYYTAFCRELLLSTEFFLLSLGIEKTTAYSIAWIVAEIIERDSAYRLRLEDLLSETTVYALISDPSYEIRKLVSILEQREKTSAKLATSFKSFSRVAIWLLKHPRIKKAWCDTLRQSTFKNFQLDDIDRYQASRLAGYEFFGIPYEARIIAFNAMHNGNPPEFGYIYI